MNERLQLILACIRVGRANVMTMSTRPGCYSTRSRSRLSRNY